MIAGDAGGEATSGLVMGSVRDGFAAFCEGGDECALGAREAVFGILCCGIVYVFRLMRGSVGGIDSEG